VATNSKHCITSRPALCGAAIWWEAILKRIGVGILISVLAGAMLSGAARSACALASDPAVGPTIHIEDVGRFYEVYDAAGGHPTADQLQHDYLDPGSDGLHQFAQLRNISGARIAETLTQHPEIYSGARRCMIVLPRVRQRLEVALRKLRRLYPEARLPPVTIAVGRGKPVGVGGGPASGVLIGLEALCATNYLNPNVEDLERRRNRAILATGSAIASPEPTTNMPPTSARPCAKSWK
jgi:hypothetical protein